MSNWIVIEKPEDIEISDDGTELEVLYSTDEFGNNYIAIPIEWILEILKENKHT